jgi:hypothetical protein
MAFPPLFHAVDAAAAEAQTQLLRLRAVEFTCLVAAAVFAEIPSTFLGRTGPILTLAFFVLALVLRVSGSDVAAERRWYEGRAAAESLKSMSWQYAAGGESFRLDDSSSDTRFVFTMKELLRELSDLDVPFPSAQDTAIPMEMRALRASTRAQRTEVYRALRVKDQLDWYERKASWNKQRAHWWRNGMIGIETVAVLLGLGRALGWYDVDWLGIFAAIAAAFAAWQQTKNYQGLSQAYAVTSHDVALVNASIGSEESEEDWAQAVHDAEAAFSREHTMWRARRQGPSV